MFKKRSIVIISLLIQSCVSVPRQVEEKYSSCKLTFHKYELAVLGSKKPYNEAMQNEIDNLPRCDGPDFMAAACVLYLMVHQSISAVSLVVSGSIVIGNNTLYWIEKSGSCDESEVDHVKKKFIKERTTDGGRLIGGPDGFNSSIE